MTSELAANPIHWSFIDQIEGVERTFKLVYGGYIFLIENLNVYITVEKG